MKDWNAKEINKIIKRLQIPKKYENMMVNTDVLLNHDITMLLSIREDAGKTFNTLLKALAMHVYQDEELHIIYCRSDKTQITKANIENLFDGIVSNGYLQKLYNGKYNHIIYKHMTHKFYLTYKEDGMNDEDCVLGDFFCQVIANENYINYKSSITDNKSNVFIYDEIGDTKRDTSRQMIEFMNNISTFLRPQDRLQKDGTPLGKVIMLGNNTDKYLFWFYEFCIEEDIDNLKYGSYIDKQTELGTTFACYLLAQSDEFKEKREKKKIHFFGFNTPKMDAFNGIQEWQADVHPHIPYNDFLMDCELIYNKLWIKHRNRYIRINIYNHIKMGVVLFLHYSNKPQKTDGFVLTSFEPQEQNECFGFGYDLPHTKARQRLEYIRELGQTKRIYFANNSVGELYQNFCNEINFISKY